VVHDRDHRVIRNWCAANRRVGCVCPGLQDRLRELAGGDFRIGRLGARLCDRLSRYAFASTMPKPCARGLTPSRRTPFISP
jgi:hypothetical protein